MMLRFKCTFLTDVVLTAQSATVGFHKSLDYIPGIKFIGILAKDLYKIDKVERTLNLFHNGNVKFSNAYPLINEKDGYPVPFSWYRDKLKQDNEVYIHHNFDDNTREKFRKEAKQIKQERSGYIDSLGKEVINLDQKFSIKSAYDSINRRSKDQQMYGYYAILEGSQFSFCIDVNDKEVSTLIQQHLIGEKKIGRSKSAEYGLVLIEEIKPPQKEILIKNQNNELIVYAHSDLCFINEFGFCTLDLTPKLFGIKSNTAEILWDKCQIKTRIYQSYNSKRNTSNADLMVVQKGSVIVIKTNIAEGLPSYVGSLQNEGFGRVKFNPSFLIRKKIAVPKEQENIPKKTKRRFYVSTGDSDELIISMIKRRFDLKKQDKSIEDEVEKFVNEKFRIFKNISPSQWGAIRAIAKSANDEKQLVRLLFHQDENEPKNSEGFLRRGIAAKTWDRKADELERFVMVDNFKNNRRKVLIKTASKMQKKTTREWKIV